MKNPKLKVWCFQIDKFSKQGRWSRSFYKFFLPEGLSTYDAYDLVEVIGYKKYGPRHYYCPEKKSGISQTLAKNWNMQQIQNSTYRAYTSKGSKQKYYVYKYCFKKHILIKQ
jgi:hypothetical protein